MLTSSAIFWKERDLSVRVNKGNEAPNEAYRIIVFVGLALGPQSAPPIQLIVILQANGSARFNELGDDGPYIAG